MPLDPNPADFVSAGQRVEFLPEINVFDRGFFVAGSPVVFLPVRKPLGNAVHNVAAVGIKRNVALFFSAFSASMTAVSSMRLLVVSASAPLSSFSVSLCRSRAPQPPAPGFPEQAPSVKISTRIIFYSLLKYSAKNSCSNRAMSSPSRIALATKERSLFFGIYTRKSLGAA